MATSLLMVAVGLAIRVGFAKTNAQVANSKLQNPVQLSQQPSNLAEKIEGIKVLRISGQIIAPSSLENMVDKADLIVIGRPSQSIAESTPVIKRDSAGFLNTAYSLTEFKVSKVLKGDLDLKTIIVGQQAAIIQEKGDVEPTLVVLEKYQPQVKNAKYILFLKKGLRNKSQFFPTGVYFGKLNIDGNDPGEKKANFGQKVKEIHAAVLKVYQVEISLPDRSKLRA